MIVLMKNKYDQETGREQQQIVSHPQVFDVGSVLS